MRAVRIRIANALHNRDMSFVVERFESREFWIQPEMIVDLEDLIGRDSKPRPRDVIRIVSIRNHCVESVVASGHLQHDKDCSVFAGDCLRR